MSRKPRDPMFDPEQIEEQDPLGETGFEAQGFEDGADGGPYIDPAEQRDTERDRRPARPGQKAAGIPEHGRHEPSTPSEERPDSEGVVIRQRGGASKGDPAVGGTRP